MANFMRAPKDFWAGLIYVVLGGAMLWFGQDYRFGTAGRMGPGYFPRVLASILVGIGVISLIRSFLSRGDAIGRIEWKPLFFILLGTALFAVLLPRAGVAIALFALCIVSAAASSEFRLDWKATLGLIGLIVACVLVFVKGLGVPMPIWGTWLEPFTTTLPAWMK